jgi:hypothetical protein
MIFLEHLFIMLVVAGVVFKMSLLLVLVVSEAAAQGQII